MPLRFEQHWEERKMFLLDENDKKFQNHINERADGTQRLIALFAFVTILVAIIVPVALNTCSTTTEIKGAVPVIVTTPIQPTPTPESP